MGPRLPPALESQFQVLLSLVPDEDPLLIQKAQQPLPAAPRGGFS